MYQFSIDSFIYFFVFNNINELIVNHSIILMIINKSRFVCMLCLERQLFCYLSLSLWKQFQAEHFYRHINAERSLICQKFINTENLYH